MPDAPADKNTVSSEDGINQFGRGRPLTSSAGQSSLYNSSNAVSRGGETIPHGQEGPIFVLSNRRHLFVPPDDARPNSVYRLHPQVSVVFIVVPAAEEYQYSPGVDGEDTTMGNTD
ncbi:uncharacterized protein FTOL_11509 [Fusarium torulosum]|uniref:Uncharacterized protein n=1 Tax=Fusarium torulosum TaxID=33205 RepID=A0AAE8MK53_9HYPO|nr:uncharacterized protein FTOL_11509 [Fusarium torulosum]